MIRIPSLLNYLHVAFVAFDQMYYLDIYSLSESMKIWVLAYKKTQMN